MINKSWLAAAIGSMLMMVGTATGFAGDLDARYMKVCRDDIQKNNPIWTVEQMTKICACRLRYFHAEQPEESLAKFVKGFEAGELGTIPEDVVQADLRYIGICSKDPSAEP